MLNNIYLLISVKFQDSLAVNLAETLINEVSVEKNSNCFYEHFPLLVVFLLGIIVGYVLSKTFSSKKSNDFKKEKQDILSKEVDFNNIMTSAFESKALFNKLKKKCHPDLFIGNDILVEKANKIFQDLSENKNDFKELKAIEIKINNDLYNIE
jgi:hypothetical protein